MRHQDYYFAFIQEQRKKLLMSLSTLGGTVVFNDVFVFSVPIH